MASSLLAQTSTTAKKTARKSTAAASASDVQALKDAVAAQQQQLQTLQQQLQQTNQQLQQTTQQFQQTQQQLQQAQQAAADAQQKAAAIESTTVQKSQLDALNAQYADVQTTLTNNALSTQDEQKRMTALETTLGRFRFNGDIRVRGESFFQRYDGCISCADRNRARIRVRFGFDGKLNDDFIAGLSIATGTLQDPTSTNTTLTNMFEKKTIGLDRGYITYNPVAAKWLSLTGGKFAYTWQRTSVTFDPDLNPEGFAERFSKDFSGVPFLKNANIQFMQLFYNEASGTGGLFKGHDSFAVGGQIGGRLNPLKFWTLTPSFTILNWRYPDAILNASAFQVGATTTGGIFTINGTSTTINGLPVPGEGPGCATPPSGRTATKLNVPNCAFGPNGLTNGTFLDANNNLHFLSGFLYADLILNNQFKTKWARLPVNLLVEYENNLNASDHPFDFTVAGAVEDPKAVWDDGQDGRPNLGKQSHAYLADISVGQQRNRGDIQVGYAFLRQEQDSVISSFNESDQRAPTNVLQHRVYALWRIRANTTASFTWWHGRTLNPFLQNAALASGLKAAIDEESGAPGLICSSSSLCNTLPQPLHSEPWLNRLQFDLIYTF
jgi:hypothetical protein